MKAMMSLASQDGMRRQTNMARTRSGGASRRPCSDRCEGPLDRPRVVCHQEPQADWRREQSGQA
eukprot:10443386-Alexandrium_andersonii.AAC.1